MEALETVLAKEFTKMTRLHRSGQPNQNTLVYTAGDNSGKPESDEEIRKRLVAMYK